MSLGEVSGVGLVPGTEILTFGPAGLTVVYGPNATGKSTYVSVLKRVCRIVDRERETIGNVFAVGPEDQPGATIRLQRGDGTEAHRLELAASADIGTAAISVFDAKCAELYVTQQNAVAYVPSELLLLTRLAATQDRMRADVDVELDMLTGQTPDLSAFGLGTTARGALESLSAETSVNDLETLATLDDAETARLRELRAILAAADSNSADADARASQQDAALARELVQQLLALQRVVEPAALESLQLKASAAAEALTAGEAAAQTFGEMPVSGVGTQPWRVLSEAARSFVEGHGRSFPPQAGSRCPLCMQPVLDGTADTLRHFEEHVHSEIQAHIDRTATEFAAALEQVDPERITPLRSGFVHHLAERASDLHATITRDLDSLAIAMTAVHEDPQREITAPRCHSIRRLNEWARERDTHATTLLAASDPGRARELHDELASLEARALLGDRLPEICAWIDTLQRISSLSKAKSDLATNRITTLRRQLTEQVVTGELQQPLREEIKRLNLEQLNVDLRPSTRVGETHLGLRLAEAPDVRTVAQIASEGEQRALALAFFLAEVRASASDGGIVLDDPVSSLDDERCTYIASRLVEEAAHRQVIVFTHDLPFLFDLREKAKDAEIESHISAVWRRGSNVGLVSDQPPFATMSFKQRLGTLKQRAQNWDSGGADARDLEAAWARACAFYNDVRATYERGIEERVLNGTVQRLQRAVKPDNLSGVKHTPQIIALVKAGMARCALFVHDSSNAASIALPNRTQVENDLDALQEFARLTQ